VQVAVVKIRVAIREALKKKERHNETQFTIKIGGKTSLFGSQLFRFVKFSFPITGYAEAGCSHQLIA
jgi:hypothetical protein